MSTFDISKISSALQSTKIKDRNDALNSLENLLSSKFRLNHKQFDILIISIFKLIEHERLNYWKNMNNVIELRLSLASSCIRLLIDRSVYFNDQYRAQGKPIKLKYKFYLNAVNFIRNNYFIEDNILDPCSLEFTKALTSIVSQGFFVEHLNDDDWSHIYNLICKSIIHILDNVDNLSMNEKLLIELYTSLHYLIKADSAISINYLQLTSSESSNSYFRLLALILQTCHRFKKESLLTVLVFKIINKLIITISTEDIKFVNKIIQIAIKIMIYFYQTQLDTLLDQFLIFLNLSATHEFLNLHNIPKLTGDSSILLDSLFENEDISIRSSDNDTTHNNSNESNVETENEEVVLYNVGILIQNLLTRIMSSNIQLKLDDVAFMRSFNMKDSWFKLNSIYLRGSNCSEHNYRPWLFNTGLSKLINSYFSFKKTIYNNNAINSLTLYNGSIMKADTTPQNKRQKMGIISDSIYQSNDILEFCSKLINDKSDFKVQQTGLQILTFHLELDTGISDVSIPSKSNSKHESSSDHSNTNLDLSESTILNSTFDFPLANYDSETQFSKNNLFRSVLNSFDDNKLNYWSLLSARSMISNSIQQHSFNIQSRYFFQLLKISLQLIKIEDLAKVSCSLIYMIISCHSNEDLNKIIDRSLITQLDNLIDLSEINGPYLICSESFDFWYTIHKVVKNVNLSKNSILAGRVQDWLISKWDMNSIIRIANSNDSNPYSEFSNFVSWLCGQAIHLQPSELPSDSYTGKFNEPDKFMNSFDQLKRFIVKDMNIVNPKVKTIEVELLGENYYKEDLLGKVLDSGKTYLNEERDCNEIFEWAILEFKIACLLEGQRATNHLVNSLEFQGCALLDVLRDLLIPSDQMFKFIKSVNNLNSEFLNQRFIAILSEYYPFNNCFDDMVKFLIKSSLNPHEAQVQVVCYHGTSNSMFDDEFLSTNNIISTKGEPSSINISRLNCTNLDYEEVFCIEAIKFILLEEGLQKKDINSTFSNVVKYLESLDSQDVLYCLLYLFKIVDSGIFDLNEISTSSFTKIIRILGEGPLTSADLERNELSIVVVSTILTYLSPIWVNCLDDGFKKDCYDMCSWLFQCGRKNLIRTETSYIAFLRFAVKFLSYNDQDVIRNTEIESLFVDMFKSSTNNIKIKILPSIIDHMKLLSVSDQMAFYKGLFLKFQSPQQSIETCATFCLFLCILSESSMQIKVAVIFNFIEYSRFPHFLPYLRISLSAIYNRMNLQSSKELFKLFKFELLKSWWNYNFEMAQFPYELFGYPDSMTFFIANYRELTAIAISTKKGTTYSANNEFLENLALVKESDVRSLIHDSLALSITLAYTNDGVRNSIYEILSGTLKEQYRVQMTEKLLSIILEIIKYTDMSKENALRDFRTNNKIESYLINNDSPTLDSPKQISISLPSSLDLIKNLIAKFSPDPNMFWDTKKLYFFFRQISSSLRLAINQEQKLLNIRKFKLIILFGHVNIYSLSLANLIIPTLSSFLVDPYLHNETADIISVFQYKVLEDFGESNSLPLIVKMVSCLIEFSDYSLINTPLLGLLEEYINGLNENGKVQLVLMACINILNSRAVTLKSSTIEDFLNDDKEFHICQKGGTNKYVMKLVSSVFKHVEVFNDTGSHENVVRLLLNISSAEYASKSKEFRLWSTTYLANYYLNGGIKHDASHIIPSGELHVALDSTFDLDISSMDSILDRILQYVESDQIDIASCAESILGVLIWKYNHKKSEVSKFLSFEKYYNTFSPYIVPLDFHSCILLNSNDDEFVILGHTLKETISNMAVSLQTLSFDLWTSRLFLSIVQELAKFTSIMPLFSSFVTKNNSFAKSALPSFICYYISVMGKEGSTHIIDLLTKFSDLSLYSPETVDLFTYILLLIRIGAKRDLLEFKDIYSNIKLDCFYRMAVKNKLYKTALMLFEDIHCDHQSVNYKRNSKYLSDIYESIDSEDLIFGLPEEASLEYAINMINRGSETSEQVKFNSGLFDSNISFNSDTNNCNILSSMINDGLLGVSKLVSKNIDTKGTNDGTFEWAWKLNNWEIPIPKVAKQEHEVLYKTLKQIHDYPTSANEICQRSLLDTLNIKDQMVDKTFGPKEFRLQVEVWLSTLASVSSINEVLMYEESDYNRQLDDFSNRTQWFETADFKFSENILLARKATFQILDYVASKSKLNKESMWLGALHNLVKYNSNSINSKESQKMISSIIVINEISKNKFSESETHLSDNINRLTKYQTALSLWHQGQTSIPVTMLKELKQNESITFSASSLNITSSFINAKLVNWMAYSRQDLASNIMEKYVLPTADMVESVKELDQKAKVFEILANFCEVQFKSRNLNDQINKLEKQVSFKRSEIEELKSHYSKMPVAAEEKKSAQRYYAKLKVQYNVELTDLNSLKNNISEFSDKAVEFYLKSILTNGDNDENLDRFFALWLEHSNKDRLHFTLSENIQALPSHKLISWSTQLVSRLSSDQTKFQNLLQKLIVDLCYDHPYHSLYNLMSLRKHESYAKHSTNILLSSKSKAANKIWQELINKENTQIIEILQKVERFCNESVKLAEHRVSRGKLIHLNKLKLGDYWVRELPDIPPPTKYLPVDLTTKYESVVFLQSINPKIDIATSGLSLPKIARFNLSDGSEHIVLFKHGTDDLRQDSIMEQVFEKVNNIFKKDKETRKRELKVRTYKAVPLGPETGIIEFVPNSIALIDAIRPYHSALDDMKSDKARDLMKNCQAGGKPERYKTFEKVCAQISPVLRYFFFDNYVTPDKWFDCRTSYTRGIATTSMVGHILGLGDRHCNNILLDKNSGEPIHIDLGVAFDQGKRLPIPETVPFRLTRDIVDGFGITGIHGVFDKSCEHTYRVLRHNKDHILAILDVLRWDPLYSWSLSPIRRKKLQNEVDKNDVGYLKPQEDGSEGGRAVLTVSDKLTAGGLSVEAIVRELVQEATSPQNLALIYCGWCPFF